jgi:hypothetical protein
MLPMMRTSPTKRTPTLKKLIWMSVLLIAAKTDAQREVTSWVSFQNGNLKCVAMNKKYSPQFSLYPFLKR